MIKIDINYDILIAVEDIKNFKEFPGVYVFLDENNIPIYVGQSSKVRLRVRTHLSSGSNTSRICHLFKKVALIHEQDKFKRLAAELYLINTFVDLRNIGGKYRPSFNNLSDYAGRPLANLCEGKTLEGKGCRNIGHSNGYCHLHGGNGIHKYEELTEST